MHMHVSGASEAPRNDVEFSYYDQLHAEKYRDTNQTKSQHAANIALNLGSNEQHQLALYTSLTSNRFLPAGRVQAAKGAIEREVSPFNCSVSQVIEDDMRSIMGALSNAALILRLGTGIGYNFSHIRPAGAEIKKLKTEASGPLSFMKMFDVMAGTIASSGHRRGAQMGILNVDHPDIEAFIDAKMQPDTFRQFNLSVGVSDLFMAAVEKNENWTLQFQGVPYKTVSAKALWNKIVHNAYDSAEPGIIFIDRLNTNNNLYYCEQIEATNPCAEQPLPPYGLCMLGSFNLPMYIFHDKDGNRQFNFGQLQEDIYHWVEAYDNIFDDAVYAIPEHKAEAIAKRRIGLGFTGIASAIEYMCGKANYGEPEFIQWLDHLCKLLRDHAYMASAQLAKNRGAFPLFDKTKYLNGEFAKTLPTVVKEAIREYGIRNSHLISFAPCGTISMCAENVSSGVEPVFHYTQSRKVHMREGQILVTIQDYNFREYGFRGKTLEECTVDEHMAVSETVQKYCDSAVSKTVNVPQTCPFDEYKTIYEQAHARGLKGMTVYRPNDKRGIVIAKAEPEKVNEVTNYDTLVAFDSIPTGCTNGACTL